MFRYQVFMVGKTGLEPAQDFSHNDLNVARIPFRHLPVYEHYTIKSPLLK